jgi:hypothetical protein
MLSDRQLGCTVAILVAVSAWSASGSTERLHPPGQIAPREPAQVNLDRAAPITVGDVTLKPRARYRFEARALSRQRYYMGDDASLIPIDIAFGWGPMSDSALISKLTISQNGRWVYWTYRNEKPVNYDAVGRSSANVHLIPASSEVKQTLLNARIGDVLTLEGELVDVWKGNRIWMSTSLTRDDTGGGACEIMYVRSASIRP